MSRLIFTALKCFILPFHTALNKMPNLHHFSQEINNFKLYTSTAYFPVFHYCNSSCVKRLCNIAGSCGAEQVVHFTKSDHLPNLRLTLINLLFVTQTSRDISFSPLRHALLALMLPFQYTPHALLCSPTNLNATTKKWTLRSCCLSPGQNNYTFTADWMRTNVVSLQRIKMTDFICLGFLYWIIADSALQSKINAVCHKWLLYKHFFYDSIWSHTLLLWDNGHSERSVMPNVWVTSWERTNQCLHVVTCSAVVNSINILKSHSGTFQVIVL